MNIFDSLNTTLIVTIATVTVGFTELIKNALNFEKTWLKMLVSVILGVGFAVGYGILQKLGVKDIVILTTATVAISQAEYSYFFKLFKELIEKFKTKVTKDDSDTVETIETVETK